VNIGIKHKLKLQIFKIFERVSPMFFDWVYLKELELARRQLLEFFGTSRELSETDKQGVLHIGASFGEEAEEYERLKLKVLWVEAIPSVFETLQKKIRNYANQEAQCALLGDRTEVVEFKLASNSVSSSIYEFDANFLPHSQLRTVKVLNLQMREMKDVFESNYLKNFTYWVLDVQGAELPVLRGAGKLLDLCKVLEVEISKTSTYKNAPQYGELDDFLKERGFWLALETPQNFHGNTIYIKVKNSSE
jgi:FkbM family methyltransferase